MLKMEGGDDEENTTDEKEESDEIAVRLIRTIMRGVKLISLANIYVVGGSKCWVPYVKSLLDKVEIIRHVP